MKKISKLWSFFKWWAKQDEKQELYMISTILFIVILFISFRLAISIAALIILYFLARIVGEILRVDVINPIKEKWDKFNVQSTKDS